MSKGLDSTGKSIIETERGCHGDGRTLSYEANFTLNEVMTKCIKTKVGTRPRLGLVHKSLTRHTKVTVTIAAATMCESLNAQT
jgi:hypothetical protein